MFLYGSNTYLSDIKTALSATVNLDKLKKSSVLITGASGLIGSFLVDMLAEYNNTQNGDVRIFAAGRNSERLQARFRGVRTNNITFVEQDVNQPIKFDFQVDYIIHAASNAYPAAFEKDPVGTILSNIKGTEYLLEYARTHGTQRLLFVSTGEVYGQCDASVTAFKEEYSGYVDPTKVRSCYPASKRAAETLCSAYSSQYGVDTVIVRPCHIYGPNTTSTDNRASVQFVNNAISGKDIVLQSSGKQMRSYCYIADCGSAVLSVLTSGETANAYNIANPDARVTIAGLAQNIADVTDTKLVFDCRKNDNDTPITYAVLDSTKLEGLGWKGRYTVQDGVRNTVEILKGN
ncbi:MAG: NAD-dependent epimerase/dehydratase family protein [Clostridia bacterium]|nr:NAD-dependent epimerase/dehydratase family protein [Clostridia bacterium]